MGTWGTAIKSSDTYQDIYGDFFELYNSGLNVNEVSQTLISKNQAIITNQEDSNDFWFALAKAQWECKQLDPAVLTKVKEIIEKGSDIKIWGQLDAEEKDVRKRQLVLEKFLAEILSERPKAKPRKKKILREPPFSKGDCLTFKFTNGNYGGVVVLDAVHGTELPYMLIATTKIHKTHKPTLQDFISAEALVLNYGNWNNKPDIGWQNFKKETTLLFEKVDNISIRKEYISVMYSFSFGPDFNIHRFEESINCQLKSEKQPKKIKMKDFF